MSLKGLKE